MTAAYKTQAIKIPNFNNNPIKQNKRKWASIYLASKASNFLPSVFSISIRSDCSDNTVTKKIRNTPMKCFKK